jgi:hypothetical protein
MRCRSSQTDHAKGARDAERLASVKRVAWDGTHDEVYVDRIRRRQAQVSAGNGCSRHPRALWSRWDGRRAIAEGRRRTTGR